MNAKKAKEALKLEGGLHIEGKLPKVSEFFKGLEFAEKAIDMQMKMQEFCGARICCDCPYWDKNEECMDEFIVRN